MSKKYDSETPAKFETESEILLADFKLGLIKLGLKGVEDINNKRVQNPTEFYNSLTALYKALKSEEKK